MKLGNLKKNWTLVYSSAGHGTGKEIDALSACSVSTGATQYFLKTKGAVYTGKEQEQADVMIAVDGDLLGIKPTGAKYKAFQKGKAEPVGWVLEAANGDLSVYDPEADGGATAVQGGLTYDAVGDAGGKTVYARLDKAAIKALRAGADLSDGQLAQYETSMKKGVIPSGSTGSDGIKFDNSTWVIKITISNATANTMDNTLSPSATPVVDPQKNAIFLNFDQLVLRH